MAQPRTGTTRRTRRPAAPVVREREVSLVELFYDLVYVYAISQMTTILSNGTSLLLLVRYLVATLVVLQAWMYMTNYVNRFGRERWYENVAMVANMLACIMVSNTLPTDWNDTFAEFSVSMLANLGTVAFLYAVRLSEGRQASETAAYSLKTLIPSCVVYAVIAIVSLLVPGADSLTLALGIVAVLTGAFGPALVDRLSPIPGDVISFPHLCERFELLTIITFGETIVTVGNAFARTGVGPVGLSVFLSVIALYGCYVVQMHDLVEHHAVHRALLLMYTHFFMVIAINLYTVSLNLFLAEGAPTADMCVMAAVALVAFFACLFLLSSYHRAEVNLASSTWHALHALVGAGTVVTLLGAGGNAAAFLAGPPIAGMGCLAVLLSILHGSRE